MKIALLGPPRPTLEKFFASCHNEVKRIECSLDECPQAIADVDWIVSYGYRHIVRSGILARFPQRIINLHISLLPWNRGADPNLWSVLENTPKGVSIHLMDEGLDTGPILAQCEVEFHPDDTLRTSYERLSQAVEALFIEKWPSICAGSLQAVPQSPGGSVHRLRERQNVSHLLVQGWDTPVKDLSGRTRRND